MTDPSIRGLSARKADARQRAKERRRAAVHALKPGAHLAMAKRLSAELAGNPACCVAAYWPLGDEADPWPGLAKHRGPIGLPVIVGPAQRLIFREWQVGDPFEEGPYGTRHPKTARRKLVPDVILVPLLAFDEDGARLGYGGGYYDRTLAHLRSQRSLIALGLAWEGQLSAEPIPVNGYDQQLDILISESHTRKWPRN